MKKALLFPLASVRLLPGMLKKRQDIDLRYLVEVLDAERMLAPYYRQAGLPSPKPPYGGWESRDIAGHSGGHYLSALAACHVATGDLRALELARCFVNGIRRCQQAHGDGYAAAVNRGCFDAVRSGTIKANGFSLNNIWVPLYNLHKLLAGLLDAYRFCGSAAALEIARKQAEYLLGVWKNLAPEQIQEILTCEHGGIAESLILLAEETGDLRFLRLAAEAFSQKSALDPLLAQEDRLNGMHGNTMIPKVIGLAELYDATGDAEARKAAEFFFERVTKFRSFANGGHGESEHFFAVGEEESHLTPFTAETCNSYNMIKLSEHIFEWEPKAETIDFVERALLNHVAANIGRNPGEFGYFLALAPVAVKVFSTPENSFWCCVGTGMESPMRYARTFYAKSDGALYVNQYFPSILSWEERKLKLTAETDFPESGNVTLRISAEDPEPFELKLRKPGWCDAMTAEVNGKPVVSSCGADGYLAVRRTWRNGDCIVLRMPMAFRSERLATSDRYAFFRGPVLLAGTLPPSGEAENPARERFEDHLKARGKTDEFPPHLIAETPPANPADAEVAPAMKLNWIPLYDVCEEHYGVYFRVLKREEWKRCEAELRKKQEAEKRLAKRIIDEVTPGFQQSEVEHGLAEHATDTGDFQHGKFRRALPGGEFSYELAADPKAAMELQVKFWGAEWSCTTLGFLIDGTLIAEQEVRTLHPGEWCTLAYPVPAESAVSGKVKLTIRHLRGGEGGRIFHLRLVKK